MTSTPGLSAGSVRDRIEAKLGPPTDTGCREWQRGDHNPAGYYSFMIDGRRVRVHRAVWELEHGPIPEGVEVLHRCDNPSCGEISHLFAGTQADNNADRAAKGRSAPQHGEHNGNTRLTIDQARAIYQRRRSGEGLRSLAAEFGVSPGHVWRIGKRERWAHV